MKVAKILAVSLASLGLAVGSVQGGVETVPTQGRNIYRLAVAELGGRPVAREIVGSTYDNRVCAFGPDGAHLWDAPVGGFVFDLATGDLNGDGRDEIVAAGADGLVYVFDAAGRKLWTADLEAPVYQVAIAKLDGKTPVVLAGGVSRQVVAFSAAGAQVAGADTRGLVRMLRAGDFDGDGEDEVAALSIRGQAQEILFFKGAQLSKLKEVIARGSPSATDPLLSLKPTNGTAVDLDGDGTVELIYPPGACTLKGGLRQLVDLPPRFKTPSYDTHYNMRLVAAGDLTSHSGAEIVVVEGPEVRLYTASGKELGRATAPFGFTDVVYLPGSPRGSVLLGSSPNGDDNFYHLTFEPGWERAVSQLERRGFMAGVGASLEQLSAAATGWRGETMQGAEGPFDVVVNHTLWSGPDIRKLEPLIDEVRAYEKRFPYARLRFSAAFWPGEKAPLLRPDGKPWGRDRRLAHDLPRAQIVAAAAHFEQERCPFWVQVGHGCSPHLELTTIAEMIGAAPTMLLGFISAEDEQPENMAYYLEHFIRPILELSLAHRKHVILRNKNVWWAYWPAEAKVRELIFNGRYRSVLLPAVEDSNSRSPDLNLASRVGLWLDGQVEGWVSRSCADWFSFNRTWEWEYVMTGHPSLRYYTGQALMGARTFMLMNGERDRSTGRWTRVAAEGAATFLHLLGTGAITPPRREQLRAISPVALAVREPSVRFKEHGTNGHGDWGWNRDGTDGQPWAFDRLDSYWGMAPLPSTDVATYLWGRQRRSPSHLPTSTPHGFVAIVPGGISRPGATWTTAWTTDGDGLSKEGRSYSLTEARHAMLADLAEAEKRLPFHVEGQVFHQVVEQGPDHYIIALEDSGWLDPAERTVMVSTRLPGNWLLVDRLTGATLGPLSAPVEVRVPAGALRLLEARRQSPAGSSPSNQSSP